MAETLGSLCDKLTIVKLKQWHSEDPARLESLSMQEHHLKSEIDSFLEKAFSGAIPSAQLTFSSNKVYKKEGNETGPVTGNIGEIFARLAQTNCALWHEQEKVYEFEKVPAGEKDAVVKQLAILNLERNQCMDAIDKQLQSLVASK